MLNLIQQTVSFVTEAGAVYATLPPWPSKVEVVADADFCGDAEIVGDALAPVVKWSPPHTIRGLPAELEHDDEDWLVPLVVAQAMRSMGVKHGGRVFSPQALVFRDGKPLGTLGLVWHEDLTR